MVSALPNVADLSLPEAALAYARAGIPVFPLAQRTKRPIYMGGFNQATTDITQITAWWEAHPGANIGAVPGLVGCIIPDIDTTEAREAWNDRVPIETAATQTGGGVGVHPWYRSPELSQRSHWRLDEHGGPFQDDRLANLLFRASGGYVVVAPSIHPDTGDPYTLVNPGTQISDLPSDITQALLTIPSRDAGGGHQASKGIAQTWFDENSKPTTSEGGQAILDQRIVNISSAAKDSRNDTLLAEVGVLLNAAYVWDINLAEAREAIRAIYIPHVADSRRERDANREVDHAFDYVATQRYWEGPLEEALGGVPLRLTSPSLAAPKSATEKLAATVETIHDSALNITDMAEGRVPDIDFVVEGIIPRHRLTSIVAEAKVGKSLLVFDMAVCLAAGVPFLGKASAPMRVLYIDYEMVPEDVSARLIDMDLDQQTIALVAQNLTYLQIPPIDPLDTAEGGAQLTAFVEHYPAEVVIVDTLAAAVDGAENDSDTFRAARRHTWNPLKAMGCTVIRLDHLGKNAARGARGSSMKRDDVDVAWELTASGQILVLKRTASRLPGIHEKIELARMASPLRHVRTGSRIWATTPVNAARAIVSAGIDPKLPMRQLREHLKRANISVGGPDLREALDYIAEGLPSLGADMTSVVTDPRVVQASNGQAHGKPRAKVTPLRQPEQEIT